MPTRWFVYTLQKVHSHTTIFGPYILAVLVLQSIAKQVHNLCKALMNNRNYRPPVWVRGLCHALVAVRNGDSQLFEAGEDLSGR